MLSLLALAPGRAQGAAVLDNFRQGSHAGTSSLSIGFTVGSGPDRLLLVGVSTASANVGVTAVSFRGMAGARVMALPVNQSGRDCRVELWRIVDPPSGVGQVSVTLSATAAMGMGMAAYSGVDQESPVSSMVTATGSASPVRVPVSVSSARPILGLACLGGTWPMLSGPDAIASSGDTNLWDFTEANVVGLGNHQALSGAGAAAISWNVIFSGSFTWGAIGLSITPAALPPPPPPDAAPDAAPDVRLAEDVLVPGDVAVPAEDAGPDPVIQPDADADAEDDASAGPDAGAPADLATPDDPDGDIIARDVNLRVGCACRLGGEGRSASLFVGALALLALSIRRRLI